MARPESWNRDRSPFGQQAEGGPSPSPHSLPTAPWDPLGYLRGPQGTQLLSSTLPASHCLCLPDRPHCSPSPTLLGGTPLPSHRRPSFRRRSPHPGPNRTGPSELASFSGAAMKVQPFCDWTSSTFHVHLLTCLLAVSFYKYRGGVSFIPRLSTGLACFSSVPFTSAPLPGADHC